MPQSDREKNREREEGGHVQVGGGNEGVDGGST